MVHALLLILPPFAGEVAPKGPEGAAPSSPFEARLRLAPQGEDDSLGRSA